MLSNTKHSLIKLSATILVLLLCLNCFILPAHASSLPFADVSSNDWYYSGVEYVYINGLMAGTSSNFFSPNSPLTRAMVVTVLHRMEENPAPVTANPFKDVNDSDYCYNATAWAREKGIVNGTTANTFSPNTLVTREQLVTMFWRYMEYKGFNVYGGLVSISDFLDAPKTSNYAVNAFRWALFKGIISGTSTNTLSPQGTSTRAQFAVMLNRLNLVIEGKEKVITSIQTPPTFPDQSGNYVGRFAIPSTGVNVACYNISSQAVVDAWDSASYFYDSEHITIADHWTQGFNGIKSCKVGTSATLTVGDVVKQYKCVGKIQGHNNGKDLTDANGNPINNIYPDTLVCYTCNDNWRNVTIVFFEEICEHFWGNWGYIYESTGNKPNEQIRHCIKCEKSEKK